MKKAPLPYLNTVGIRLLCIVISAVIAGWGYAMWVQTDKGVVIVQTVGMIAFLALWGVAVFTPLTTDE